jgi:hypothetical protein
MFLVPVDLSSWCLTIGSLIDSNNQYTFLSSVCAYHFVEIPYTSYDDYAHHRGLFVLNNQCNACSNQQTPVRFPIPTRIEGNLMLA